MGPLFSDEHEIGEVKHKVGVGLFPDTESKCPIYMGLYQVLTQISNKTHESHPMAMQEGPIYIKEQIKKLFARH